MVLLVINLLLFRCIPKPLLSFMTQGNGHINMKEAWKKPSLPGTSDDHSFSNSIFDSIKRQLRPHSSAITLIRFTQSHKSKPKATPTTTLPITTSEQAPPLSTTMTMTPPPTVSNKTTTTINDTSSKIFIYLFIFWNGMPN